LPSDVQSPEEAVLKKTLYVDMDGVLVDFESGVQRISAKEQREYEGRLDDVPGIFALMDPMPGALEAYRELSQLFDTYILSTAPWENVSAWSDKLLWVKRHLGGHPGDDAYKRLILTHHKDLNAGDFLIDDRGKHGSDRFVGEHILFGSARFPDWPSVMDYLRVASHA
jgi:5'-nucleotidase